MYSLTKYEILKYRHLLLLKELRAAEVSVTYSQIDGKWTIGMCPSPMTVHLLKSLTAAIVAMSPAKVD